MPDRVEFPLSLQQPSPLIWNMGEALRSILEREPNDSCFYADAIATALAAHLLTHYATRRHVLKEYDGLPKAKLKSAIEYINTHLNECGFANPSHFARCFRQQMGITPKQFRLLK